MSVPFAAFGPGILIAQRTDITIPSPINVGYAQEFSLELAGNTKQLYGQKQYPLVAARGTIKSTGKFKSAVLSGLAWNTLMFGQGTGSTANGFSTGGIAWTVDSTFTATTAGTLQIGSSATFEADLGVKYSTSGLPFQRVSTASSPGTGQYNVTATGQYTFGAADNGVATKITYTSTTGTGQSLIVSNQMIGATPTFQLDYYTSLNQPTAKPFVVRIYACVMSKEALAFKLEDFALPEFEFDIFANASDYIFDFVFPEVS